MLPEFETVVFTQDWHPADHVSFAGNHDGAEPFGSIDLPYGSQTLWPAHCVQGSEGAEFHADLNTDCSQVVIRKGFRSGVDSYSAFFENDRQTVTGLHGYLSNRGVASVVLAGLATDYCVAWSALDAARLGLDTTVVLDGCRAIDLEGSLSRQIDAMRHAGVKVTDSL
jgi:nicotinamidase/pyrazinamidase